MELTDLLRSVSKFVIFKYNLILFCLSLQTDTKWLSWLAYQFHIAVGKRRSMIHNGSQVDDCMDLHTFKSSFYFKVVCIRIYKKMKFFSCILIYLKPELADCLFDYLDTDKTGQLTLDKFIRNLEFIVESSDNEKVEFLFKIFDRDGLHK